MGEIRVVMGLEVSKIFIDKQKISIGIFPMKWQIKQIKLKKEQ